MVAEKPMVENIQMNMELVAAVAPEAISSEHGLIIILMEVAADINNQMLETEAVVVAAEAQVDQIQARVRAVLTAEAPEATHMVATMSKTAKMDIVMLAKPAKGLYYYFGNNYGGINMEKKMNINKENEFIKNAKEIRAIAVKEGVDVGIALDMYCSQQGIKYAPYSAEQREFLEACRTYTLDKIVKEMH